MDDIERFEQLINGGNCCISIVTFEEQYALEIVRQVALGLERNMLIWSVAGGVRDGMLTDSLYIGDTETPAAGLLHFTGVKQGSICVVLDLAEQLKTGMVLRALRDLIDCFEKNGCTLVMINSNDNLPEVVRSYTRRFEISFPDIS